MILNKVIIKLIFYNPRKIFETDKNIIQWYTTFRQKYVNKLTSHIYIVLYILYTLYVT